ncbi:MAG TPA: transcriptional repressor [Phycisphaerae bacterium]|jgi:Fur family ferric uptake transcriptional regulator|nr:transcriptional repressor [Phycisphaerae bacterium]
METPEHVFRDFLRQRKLKYTTERLAVLKAVQKFGRPFEAEELLLALRESEYRISKATIYRTLKHLLEAGLIRQTHFGGGKQAHYDFVGGEGAATAHDHLVDLETGKIIPFSNEEVTRLSREIAKKLGFTVAYHRFQIVARKATGPQMDANGHE